MPSVEWSVAGRSLEQGQHWPRCKAQAVVQCLTYLREQLGEGAGLGEKLHVLVPFLTILSRWLFIMMIIVLPIILLFMPWLFPRSTVVTL